MYENLQVHTVYVQRSPEHRKHPCAPRLRTRVQPLPQQLGACSHFCSRWGTAARLQPHAEPPQGGLSGTMGTLRNL